MSWCCLRFSSGDRFEEVGDRVLFKISVTVIRPSEPEKPPPILAFELFFISGLSLRGATIVALRLFASSLFRLEMFAEFSCSSPVLSAVGASLADSILWPCESSSSVMG